jgi:hypothetical protein
MTMKTADAIDWLVEDLAPVRAISPLSGLALTLAVTMAASLAVAAKYGVRADLLAGEPTTLVILRSSMLLLMGFATLLAAVSSARPAIGSVHSGWQWTLAAALLFPLTALVQFIGSGTMESGDLAPHLGRYCLGISGASALLIGATLTLWLRRGAPTSLDRAGWLVGLAAGSFGTFAYSLHCPMSNIYYVGLWYSLAVGFAAVVGRLVVPKLIRW